MKNKENRQLVNRRMIELDKEYLELKEKLGFLNGDLKEYTKQQWIDGLRVCNIQQEIIILERKIEDVQVERGRLDWRRGIGKARKR